MGVDFPARMHCAAAAGATGCVKGKSRTTCPGPACLNPPQFRSPDHSARSRTEQVAAHLEPSCAMLSSCGLMSARAPPCCGPWKRRSTSTPPATPSSPASADEGALPLVPLVVAEGGAGEVTRKPHLPYARQKVLSPPSASNCPWNEPNRMGPIRSVRSVFPMRNCRDQRSGPDSTTSTPGGPAVGSIAVTSAHCARLVSNITTDATQAPSLLVPLSTRPPQSVQRESPEHHSFAEQQPARCIHTRYRKMICRPSKA